MQVVLFGTPDSVYVRMVRLVLEVKNIGYDIVIADVFEKDSLPSDYAVRHPFGRMPAIEIDGVRLYETDAIVHYLDALHPQPPLLPADPLAAARIRQIMRVVDNYAYPALVWGIYVPLWWRGGSTPDAAAVTSARRALAALADLAAAARLDAEPSLAWCYLAPVLAALDSVETGTRLLDEQAGLRAWWNEVRDLPAMVATRSAETQS